MSKVVDRFLNYVKFDTKSDDDSNSVPTTKGQLVLAQELGEELERIGLVNVSVDANGYVMAELPANINKNVPVIGFIAHMDTSPDISGKDVKPKFVENYSGEDIVLNKEKNVVLAVKDFPELKEYIGQTLITTDGTTLLGADDKAGVAEIITAVEYLANHPEIPHGTVKVGITPDEEVGRGSDYFNVEKFNAKFAYTVDGGPVGELEFENFNAAGATVKINGRNVHPGTAKNKMVNSMLIANEFIGMLPDNQTPATTDGYDGFYHLVYMNGEVELTTLKYIIRDFDKVSFENRKSNMEKIAEKLNVKYGSGTVEIEIRDQYLNMKEKIQEVKYIVDIAFKAMQECNVIPKVNPIRGGTDGAKLSFMGLPTPNLFTGGHNFHGKYEFIPTFAMEKAVDVILKIVELCSRM